MVGGGRKGKEGKGPKGEGDMKRRISEGRVRVGVRGLSPGSEIVIKVPSLEIEFEFRDTMFVRRIRGPCGVGAVGPLLKGRRAQPASVFSGHEHHGKGRR